MASYTLTMTELYQEFRKIGIKSSPKAIGKMIQNGLLPFAKVINIGETGRCTYLIYRVDFERWVEEMKPKAAEVS